MVEIKALRTEKFTSNLCTFHYVTLDKCHNWCHQNIEKGKSNRCIYLPYLEKKNTWTQWWEPNMSGVIYRALIKVTDILTAYKEKNKRCWVMYRGQVTLTEWETQSYQVLLPRYLWFFRTMLWFCWSSCPGTTKYTYNRNILYPHLLK